MAAQAAMISDTIVGLKRALLRQEKDDAPDDGGLMATNRGNKLRAGAKHAREGTLGGDTGPGYFRKRVKHAEYERDVLDYNPIGLDSEGDEVDEGDEEHIDPDVTDENPYGLVHLEDLLCSLKHPSDLATHPSMSEPYRSRLLKDMVAAIDEQLRQERNTLFKAKRLLRELLGDAPWMPCGFLQSEADRNIFYPRWGNKREDEKPVANGNPGNVDQTQGEQLERTQQNRVEATKSEPSIAVDGYQLGRDHRDDANENHDYDETESDIESDSTTPAADADSETDIKPHNHPQNNLHNRRRHRRHHHPRFSPTLPHVLFLAPPIVRPDQTGGLPPPEADDLRRLLWSFVQKQEETVRGLERVHGTLLRASRMRAQVWDWCLTEAHVGEMSDGEDWWDDEQWGLLPGELRKGADTDEEIAGAAAREDEAARQAAGGRRGRGRRG